MERNRDDPYARWRELLVDRFGDWENRFSEWESARRKLSVGDVVTGQVVARAPFGAWVDVHVGFPALLEIPRIAGLTPADYQNGNWCHEGTTIEVLIADIAEEHIAIGVTQRQSDLEDFHE